MTVFVLLRWTLDVFAHVACPILTSQNFFRPLLTPRPVFAKLAGVQEVVTLDSPVLAASAPRQTWRTRLRDAATPRWHEYSLAGLSSLLLVVSFPDFDLWPLAWVALVPLLCVIARRPRPLAAFGLGWATGALFFYGTSSR